jgi:hypothetical protein
VYDDARYFASHSLRSNDFIPQLDPIRPLGSHVHRQQGEGFACSHVRHPTRRSHFPTDVDIRTISPHAQAEALVQRAQQSILDMDDRCGRGVDNDDDLDGERGVRFVMEG